MASLTNTHVEPRLRLLETLILHEYEVKRAFEQYNEVDPRNRLVAAELEKRWNVKLLERDKVKAQILKLQEKRRPISEKERQQIRELGSRFSETWENRGFPIETKKKIMRTTVEEIVVNLDDTTKLLHFIIHWKGGCHTEFKMKSQCLP